MNLMDLGVIKTIIHLMEKAGLAELEMVEGKSRIHLKRRVKPAAIAYSPVIPVSIKPEVKPTNSQEADKNLIAITAPIDGIFYQATSPDLPPMIVVDQQVSSGDYVCIIELMKTMNYIDSKVTGVVRQILVQDKQEVSTGQKLFLLEPTDEQDEQPESW